MVIRITTMVITTISSTNVNPRVLPLGIRRAIGTLFGCLGIYVEHVLAAPALRLGLVLVAAQAPLVLAGERIAGDAPEEAHLGPLGVIHLHAFHQHLQALGIAVGACLHGAEIAGHV